MLHFEFLNKNDFNQHAECLFEILATNMNKIAPSGSTYNDDYIVWKEAVGEGIKKEKRQIIVIFLNDVIIGFFQYFINNDMFMMEEIQFKEEQQGKNNIFRDLYSFVFSVLPNNIKYVEAYANKLNDKSNAILLRLGLKKIGENKSGKSYHYRGNFSDLLAWYNRTK